MGYYTTIKDNEQEWQIYTGDENFQTYRVGDKVDFQINRKRFGDVSLEDDVYQGWGDSKKCWIVIKDHIVNSIHCVVDDSTYGWYNKRYELYEKYEIKPVDKKEWSLTVRVKYRVKEAKRKIAYSVERFYDNHWVLRGATPMQKLGYHLSKPVRLKLDYSGIFRKAFRTEPIYNSFFERIVDIPHRVANMFKRRRVMKAMFGITIYSNVIRQILIAEKLKDVK